MTIQSLEFIAAYEGDPKEIHICDLYEQVTGQPYRLKGKPCIDSIPVPVTPTAR